MIGRSRNGYTMDTGPTRQSASSMPPEDTIFKVSTAHLDPSRWIILYTAVQALVSRPHNTKPYAVTLTVGVELDRRVVCLPREVT